MEDRFEYTFILDAPPDLAWERLTSAPPPEGSTVALRDGQRWMPAFEGPISELAVEPGRQLRVVKDTMPCKGTEIVVSLEASGTGTRVTVVQSGFGAMFEAALESLTIGWDHIVADLQLYLDRGVRGGRHLLPWGGIGCGVRQAGGGLEVMSVNSGSFAERAGLRAGDILITFAGAPVSNQRDFSTATRVVKPGQEVEFTCARERELVRGAAVV